MGVVLSLYNVFVLSDTSHLLEREELQESIRLLNRLRVDTYMGRTFVHKSKSVQLRRFDYL